VRFISLNTLAGGGVFQRRGPLDFKLAPAQVAELDGTCDVCGWFDGFDYGGGQARLARILQ